MEENVSDALDLSGMMHIPSSSRAGRILPGTNLQRAKKGSRGPGLQGSRGPVWPLPLPHCPVVVVPSGAVPLFTPEHVSPSLPQTVHPGLQDGEHGPGPVPVVSPGLDWWRLLQPHRLFPC